MRLCLRRLEQIYRAMRTLLNVTNEFSLAKKSNYLDLAPFRPNPVQEISCTRWKPDLVWLLKVKVPLEVYFVQNSGIINMLGQSTALRNYRLFGNG